MQKGYVKSGRSPLFNRLLRCDESGRDPIVESKGSYQMFRIEKRMVARFKKRLTMREVEL